MTSNLIIKSCLHSKGRPLSDQRTSIGPSPRRVHSSTDTHFQNLKDRRAENRRSYYDDTLTYFYEKLSSNNIQRLLFNHALLKSASTRAKVFCYKKPKFIKTYRGPHGGPRTCRIGEPSLADHILPSKKIYFRYTDLSQLQRVYDRGSIDIYSHDFLHSYFRELVSTKKEKIDLFKRLFKDKNLIGGAGRAGPPMSADTSFYPRN